MEGYVRSSRQIRHPEICPIFKIFLSSTRTGSPLSARKYFWNLQEYTFHIHKSR